MSWDQIRLGPIVWWFASTCRYLQQHHQRPVCSSIQPTTTHIMDTRGILQQRFAAGIAWKLDLSVNSTEFSNGIAIAEPAPANMLIALGMFNIFEGGWICQFSKKFAAHSCCFRCWHLPDARRWLSRADRHQASPVVEAAETNSLSLHSTSAKLPMEPECCTRYLSLSPRDKVRGEYLCCASARKRSFCSIYFLRQVAAVTFCKARQ